MNFRLVIEVEAERIEGKFAGRDELVEQLIEEVEGSQPSELQGDAEGIYEVTDFSVSEETIPKGKVAVYMTPKQAEKWNAAKAGAR